MTKEEAIKYLQQLYPNGGHCWLDEQRIEAIGMAVKALQEEPVSKDYRERYKCIAESEEFRKNYDSMSIGDIVPVEEQEPVSEELIYVAKQYVKEHVIGIDKVTFSIATDMFISGAKWRKQKDFIVSDDLEKIVEEIAEPTILNAYGTKELARRLRNTICGTSVIDGLEEAAKNHTVERFRTTRNEFLAEKCKWSFKAGAKWQKTKDESSTQDLGEYINELSKQFPEVSFAKLSRIAVRLTNWHKQQMMAKAIDVEVKVDAGGYPYIPQIELYDYDKDIPLAKEGDKYKVVLIKKE